MDEIRVFVLRFEDRSSVERAYVLVSADAAITSCIIEPESLRIRFLAGEKKAAALLQRIYERCRLVWCKRHPLQVGPDAE